MGTEGGRKIIPGREKEYRETITVGVRDVLAKSEVVEGVSRWMVRGADVRNERELSLRSDKRAGGARRRAGRRAGADSADEREELFSGGWRVREWDCVG
jgi:hypothetical protein